MIAFEEQAQQAAIRVGMCITYRNHPAMPAHHAVVCEVRPGGVTVFTGRGLYKRWVQDKQIVDVEGE